MTLVLAVAGGLNRHLEALKLLTLADALLVSIGLTFLTHFGLLGYQRAVVASPLRCSHRQLVDPPHGFACSSLKIGRAHV